MKSGVHAFFLRFFLYRTTNHRMNQFMHLCVAACAMLGMVAATAVYADPPSRVGRVGYIEGDVSFYADRNEGWQKARLNFPVTSENSIWTENQARAEVRIGASALRIDDNSILDFIKVNDDRTQAFLQRGRLNIRTRSYGADNYRDGFRIETNEGRFVIEGNSNGRYRIDASPDGSESRISVFAGRARFESAGSTSGNNRFNVDPGKTLIVRGDNGVNDFRFENTNESQLDRWADARDRQWDDTHTRYVSEQSVSPYMTGYEELDNSGDWSDDREYGRLWTPRVVVAGWAPYRYGSWSYVRPWGWTWIDDAPWGFAPFHYGRWVHAGSRWAWCPGTYVRRPVYAPALVGWYGRPGVNINISVGPSIGWFPLAPREYYVPQYTNNVTYIRNINHITNNITVINPPTTYANQTPGATFVNGGTFVNARPVQNNVIKVGAKELAAHPIAAAPNASPFPTEMNSRALSSAPSNINSKGVALNAATMPGRAGPVTAQPLSGTGNVASSTPLAIPQATPTPKNNGLPVAVPGFNKPMPQVVQTQPAPATSATPIAAPQPSFAKPPKPVQEAASRLPISPISPTSPNAAAAPNQPSAPSIRSAPGLAAVPQPMPVPANRNLNRVEPMPHYRTSPEAASGDQAQARQHRQAQQQQQQQPHAQRENHTTQPVQSIVPAPVAQPRAAVPRPVEKPAKPEHEKNDRQMDGRSEGRAKGDAR